MSIQNVSLTLYTPDPPTSPTESDPQVKHIEAQIKDWETCPTTDTKTKKQIVSKLVEQVDSIKDSIKNHEKVNANSSSQTRLDTLI